ncbi:cytochrome b/b6 domain-containing protein [Granulicella arctica]|uniref:cytochrome b/b6 domain-containing protein n=1 Tax=Granulicella arctica TaxID=940613 RepID=UPI0021E08892|nr:cytochrome b/b6 domain-containing protein [Granulicella arctica]
MPDEPRERPDTPDPEEAMAAPETASVPLPSLEPIAQPTEKPALVEEPAPELIGPIAEEPEPEEIEPPVAKASEPTIRLERKHPLAIRWMHWINFPILFTMIWSGLLIYWTDSDPIHGNAHQIYRVGIGSFTLFRFFPDWFWTSINAQYRVTTGLAYHFFFMWLFAINGVLYVSFLAISKEWKFMVPDRKSIVEAIQVTLVDLHIRKGLPLQKKYNGAQKIAYTSVILMGAGSLVTGISIYKPAQLHLLTTLLGGYQMARWEHFLLTLGFSSFFVVHVGQVILAGWNNFRSMVTGYEIKRVEEPSLEAERRSW